MNYSSKDGPAADRPLTPPPDSPFSQQFAQVDALRSTLTTADANKSGAHTPEPDLSDDDLDIDNIEVDIGPDFSHELPGEDNDHDEAPVFAYEFAGGHHERPGGVSGSAYTIARDTWDTDPRDVFDAADPTLEKFPCSRAEILERVRTLGTGLDVDVFAFDGFPPSPLVSAGRKCSAELTADLLSVSPKMSPKTSSASSASSASSPRTLVHVVAGSAGSGGAGAGAGAGGRQQPLGRRPGSKDGANGPSPSASLHCIMEEVHLD